MLKKIFAMMSTVVVAALIFAAPTAAASCESVTSLVLQEGRITSAMLIAAGAFTAPGGFMMGGPSGAAIFRTLPAFCRVTATLAPTSDSDIKIEVWMPEKNWNGKFVGIGNGVWAGNISYSAMAEPLAIGYAVAATDTGHVGTGLDAKFAVGHPEKLVDFGHRAIHEMTVKAKAVVAAYYGQKERKSLWVGCSTGGRQGLMEAYRYPEDYDGISSMAPANPMVPLMVGTLWTGYAGLKDDASRLTMPKLTAVRKASIEACDAKDGLKDGIVSDPEQCRFDPGVLQCKDKDGDDCLTAAQVMALRAIYGGTKNPRTGETVIAGYEPGSEQQLMVLIGGKEPFSVATSYFGDIVFANPQWDYKSYDYDKDLAATFKAGSGILDVPPDGLGKFFRDGRKLLLSHGWADGLIPAANTAAFYKSMTAKMDAKTKRDSVRLFMIPGMGHCGGGEAPVVTDMIATIDKWVEKGEAPERIIASRPPEEKPMTRPLCPYPKVAKYKGTGSTDDAANFACEGK
jgi:pimeloyl-ACP methyl ester carboxylesterase